MSEKILFFSAFSVFLMKNVKYINKKRVKIIGNSKGKGERKDRVSNDYSFFQRKRRIT